MSSFDTCHLCGRDAANLGLPMFEEFVVPNDWPGEWGGFAVCKPCFDANDNPSEPRLPRVANSEIVCPS
jgi:hypothetical protein